MKLVKMVQATIGITLAVSMLSMGSYSVWASCNGQVSTSSPTTTGPTPPSCTQVTTDSTTCQMPNPPANNDCQQANGTVATHTTTGLAVTKSAGIAAGISYVCSAGLTGCWSITTCSMNANSTLGSGPGTQATSKSCKFPTY
jgi:hypothetical protein